VDEEEAEGRGASFSDHSTMMIKQTNNNLFADSSQRSSTSTTTTTTAMLDASESSCELRFISDNDRTDIVIC
jgi:hypothetical protein